MRALMLLGSMMLISMHAFATVAVSTTSPGVAANPNAPAVNDDGTRVLIDGIRYQVLKTGAPNASIGQFIDIDARWLDAKGRAVSTPWSGRQTVPFMKLRREFPALARMVLVSPKGEKRLWMLAPQHLPKSWVSSSEQRVELTVLGYPDVLKAPVDLIAPPAKAIRTASGLRYLVLKKGRGGTRPTIQSTITLDYIGWDAKGSSFDSSLPRGQPATLPLKALIPGWQEAVPLMSVGDTIRVWIPGHLAYDAIPGPGPKGPLVFDISLHGFTP